MRWQKRASDSHDFRAILTAKSEYVAAGGFQVVRVAVMSGGPLLPRHACATNSFSDKASDIHRPAGSILRRGFISWSRNWPSATASCRIASSPSTDRRWSPQGKANCVGWRVDSRPLAGEPRLLVGDVNVWTSALAIGSRNRSVADDGRFTPWLHSVRSIRPISRL